MMMLILQLHVVNDDDVDICIKDSSSQVESSAGSFLHLMRYSEMDLFFSWRILLSVMASGSNMIFPSSSSHYYILKNLRRPLVTKVLFRRNMQEKLFFF
jgi:hypothetical protein